MRIDLSAYHWEFEEAAVYCDSRLENPFGGSSQRLYSGDITPSSPIFLQNLGEVFQALTGRCQIVEFDYFVYLEPRRGGQWLVPPHQDPGYRETLVTLLSNPNDIGDGGVFVTDRCYRLKQYEGVFFNGETHAVPNFARGQRVSFAMRLAEYF